MQSNLMWQMLSDALKSARKQHKLQTLHAYHSETKFLQMQDHGSQLWSQLGFVCFIWFIRLQNASFEQSNKTYKWMSAIAYSIPCPSNTILNCNTTDVTNTFTTYTSYLPNSKANNGWATFCNSKIVVIHCIAFWEITCLRALRQWWY